MSAPVKPDQETVPGELVEAINEIALPCECKHLEVNWRGVVYDTRECPEVAHFIASVHCHCGNPTNTLLCVDHSRAAERSQLACGACRCPLAFNVDITMVHL